MRPYGVVRIDSACGPGDWLKDPKATRRRIAETSRRPATIAGDHGERLAAEGEICWGGMHRWKRMVELLEMVDGPSTLGFQADMAHTLLYTLGYNAPEDRILPGELGLEGPRRRSTGPQDADRALRPWTIDFHVAQNDATVKGSGSHDKTGRHCLPDDPTASSRSRTTPASGCATSNGNLTKKVPAHLLGRLHVPQRRR